MDDLVRRVLAEGAFGTDPGSQPKDIETRQRTIQDSWGSIPLCVPHLPNLNGTGLSNRRGHRQRHKCAPPTKHLRQLHASLLENCSWAGGLYSAPGITRTSTESTVTIHSHDNLLSLRFPHSPHWSAQQYIERRENPFAVASRFHHKLSSL